MIIVLSSVRPSLEEALADRGSDILVIVPATIADERRVRAAGRYPIRTLPSWDDLGQLARLATELVHVGVTSIETTDEQCLRAAALLRSMLDVPGHSWGQALRATDKAVQKDVLAAAAVPVAGHRRIDSVAQAPAAAADLGWPLVIKPRRGFGTLGTRVVANPAALSQLIDSKAFGATELPAGLHGSGLHLPLDEIPGGLVAEEYVDVVTEYHCEILRWQGEDLYTLPARYVAPLLGSHLVGSVLLQPGAEHNAVAGLARAAADALDLQTGFAHVEILHDGNGTWRVGEIGLRPGGAKVPHLLQLQHGIEVPQVAADLAQRRRPRIELAPTDHTTAWVSATAPRGRVTGITSTQQIRDLPGVIDARSDLATGDHADGPLGSVALATHVFTRAADAEEAERAALSASRAWLVTTDDHDRAA